MGIGITLNENESILKTNQRHKRRVRFDIKSNLTHFLSKPKSHKKF